MVWSPCVPSDGLTLPRAGLSAWSHKEWTRTCGVAVLQVGGGVAGLTVARGLSELELSRLYEKARGPVDECRPAVGTVGSLTTGPVLHGEVGGV